jgi:hypothetical protein
MQTRDLGADAGAPDLFSLLYVSKLASGDGGEVARICARSRDNNLRDDITGLLVFDGSAFCQYVEGPRAAVASLLGRLERDRRHLNMHVLRLAPVGGGRRFPSWRLGYAFSADPEAIARIEASGGDAAMDPFAGWLGSVADLAASDA